LSPNAHNLPTKIPSKIAFDISRKCTESLLKSLLRPY
jgi:hypothetical protein